MMSDIYHIVLVENVMDINMKLKLKLKLKLN
eukprot:CAMPEP_0170803542 /NCGR_PEP_ID=MMETSP0733-20121128/30105_1 /TAXON_ID=186038 /ORGANISM="Fragilariopsis kerguelensis, Strain L26-C5" /LENGTH=30 /DNA_ID= /DNA_START= /DNA_END= /DNA_ORIENTATION=